MKTVSSRQLKKIILSISLFIITLLITTIPASLVTLVPSKVGGPPLEAPANQRVIDGLPYTHRLRVYTTSYDSNCLGCRGRTYSGTEVKKGVCAVDPKVIPLGSWFYIPNYGKCHAEDIGGAVKGLRVDVGWEDAKKGWLPRGWKDIYLLK